MNNEIYLKRNEDKRIKSGNLWIFSNELEKIDENLENGDLIDVYNSKKEFIATGFINKNSLIAVRLLSYTPVNDLLTLFKERLIKANELRKELYPGRNSYRLSFSESDYLPGLIIDKYNDTYVLQIASAGMQKNIKLIIDILVSEFKAKNIFTKNEPGFRKMENLPEEDTIYYGGREEEIIEEFGVKYKIDFEDAQKTGFYFDQSDNRVLAAKYCNNKTVLDAFCNQGGFGLHALLNKAINVHFIDSNKNVTEQVKNNIALNNISNENNEYSSGDVFQVFNELIANKKEYDVVIVDPPAFAKNKKSLPQAKKGYEKLNRLALQLVKGEGYLITSSCSYHLDDQEFITVINNAAQRAGKYLQLIEYRNASLDHPKLLSMKETSYLKFAICKII